jgi:Fe-S-cluster containining protein
MCCRYIALPLDEPADRETFEEIRWFLMHEGVTVFVTDGQWYLSVSTACRHLDEKGMCGAYATRPAICRKYGSDNCDYHGGEYEYQLFFTHPQQLADYAAEKLGDAWTAPTT